ncbi:hypothetical protein BOSEA31B_11488 [Hyphomicrobiales bacterium]|nr:hypothetical protein BOSEA31B_11488 [Hyphomicrobiales bacterium]CAH1697284.1 hypothetical protein BOSEA1005_10321 [Hyphomicrobiales bacterium]CAI0342851.1 hypothetical protein BO1005MUT1_10144 [Hyphomicrobiales bacterium]
MPKFTAEITVIRRAFVTVEAPDADAARKQLSNLEFDPEQATEIVGWKISPTLKREDESRPYGKAESGLDMYKREISKF